jgi:membrane protease YdiL (CAAX protease family)
MVVLALLLCLLVALLSPSLQQQLHRVLDGNPTFVFLAPALLAAVFCATASRYGCLGWRLALLILVYTFAPTLFVYIQIWPSQASTRSWLDFAVILMLWLPLELSVGADLIPQKVQGVLHATAYGIAVTLGVILFLFARHWAGMRYNLPQRFSDLRNAIVGFVVSCLLLIPLGRWVGFLAHPHSPGMSFRTATFRIVLIFFGTAFPEEILFRALIQNWFSQRLRKQWKAVTIGSLIFGASHLNNAPGPLPNWRYMVVAMIAGLIFGAVFLRSTSVFASVTVHAAVNTTKYLFF